MDMSLGRVREGRVKNCGPVFDKYALYELAPNGPDACEVGEDAEAVSEPVMPVTSVLKLSGLNG